MSEKFDSLFKEIFSYLDSGQYEIAILRINEILKIDLANTLAKNLLIFIYIQTKELEFGKIIFGIYAVGFIWGLLRIILGLIVIKRIKESARSEQVENELIYFNKNIESPFSFIF
jgi:hypothetical protein